MEQQKEYYIGFDFETQGVDVNKDLPTEIGIVAFDEDFNQLYEFSSLIKNPDQKPQNSHVIKLTGITDEMIAKEGVPEADVIASIHQRLKGAKALFAHNKNFDRAVLNNLLARHGLEPLTNTFVCTLRDIVYPDHMTCKKLSHLAYEHSIYVDPRTLHRATDDVKLMIRVLQQYDLQETILNATEAKLLIRLMDMPKPWNDGGKANEWAKETGFKFESTAKNWEKEVRESIYNQERETYKYDHKVIDKKY